MLCYRSRCDKQRARRSSATREKRPVPSCMEKSPKIAAIANSALKPTDKLASRLLGSPPSAIASASHRRFLITDISSDPSARPPHSNS